MEYDNTNTGVLFKNDKGDNEKRPDYKGSVNVNGTDFWIAGWIKERKDGTGKFMSLQVEAKDAQARPQQSSMPPAPAATVDDDDDIQF